MRTLDEIRSEIARFDRILRPIADRPVDIGVPDWPERWKGWDPLAEAGLKAPVQDLLSEIFTRYVDGPEPDREALRAMFREFEGFAWAAEPREAPASLAGLQARLLLLSLRDQGRDPRDTLLEIDGLISAGAARSAEMRLLLADVAAISSDRDRYGMGSTRKMLLEKKRAFPA